MMKRKGEPNGKSSYYKQIFVTALCACISLAALAGATAAWFANNRSVESSGMQIQMDPQASLIISKEETTGYGLSVSFDLPQTVLKAATHPDDYHAGTGLKYYPDPERISGTTGLSSGQELAEVPVPATGMESEYFRDYTVYVASAGKAFDDQTLKATLTLVKDAGAPETTPDYIQAMTVDFYVGTDYAGKLNIAGQGLTDVALFSGSIPLYTDGGLKVTMRCYFDGDLRKTEGQAYIRTFGLALADGYTLMVTFDTQDTVPATP